MTVKAPVLDSHVHLDQMQDAQWRWAREKGEKGVYHALIPGVQPLQWSWALDAFADFSWLDVAMGLHPWMIEDGGPPMDEMEWLPALEEALVHPSVVAVGEVGLDFARWRTPEARRAGEALFVRHIELARAHDLPLMLHVVRAHARTIELLKTHAHGLQGIVHAFTGSRELFDAYRSCGFLVGLGSAVTDPRRSKLRAMVQALPAEGWLLETDAPFMMIDGQRGSEGPAVGILRVYEAVQALRGADENVSSLRMRLWEQYRTVFSRRHTAMVSGA